MKTLRLLLLLTGLVLGGALETSAQVFDWAKLARGSRGYSNPGTGSATDQTGNTYTIISFGDTLHVGTQTLLATAGNSAVVKYDSTGRVQWVRQLRDIYLQNGIAIDRANGGIFVLGQTQSANASWAGTPVSISSAGSFYAKCSAAGALLWTRTLPEVYGSYHNQSMFNRGGALTADGVGNCYIMGNVARRTTLNGMVLDSTTTFLMQANATGVPQWTRIFRTSNYNGTSFGVAQLQNVDVVSKPSGGCVVMGYCNQNLYFSASGAVPTAATTPVLAGPATTGVGQNSFLANMDVNGSLLWAQPAPPRTTTAPAGGNFFAAAADAAGNCYGTGRFGNAGFGLVKYNAAGVQQWLTASAALPAGQVSGGTADHLAVDNAGNVTVIVASSLQQPSIQTTVVIGSVVLRSPYNIVRFNAQGQAQWAVGDTWQRPAAGTANRSAFLEPLAVAVDGTGNIYYTSNIVVSSDTTQRPVAIAVGPHTLAGRGMVLTRVGVRHNTITGTIYLDQNGNGQRDAGDLAFPQTLVVQAQPALSTLSTPETDGRYRLYTGPGAYTVAAPVAPVHYVQSQPSASAYTGSFSGYGGIDSTRHFGFRPVSNQADVRVTLTPYGAVRPGFITRYRLTLENVGTTVVSGNATATLDSRMSYISSTPSGSRSGQTITWAYTNLAPFARREFDVQFSLPINVALGTVLTSTAAAPLAADVVPADNNTSVPQTVTGSFDPNDITVNYSQLSPAQVALAQPLDYTVRFQNMGTDTAFTVVLSDTLDFRKLNLASIQLLAHSHNCTWMVSNQGLLTVRFLNIKLPQRNVNVIRSQGFVRFRLQPRTTLTVGEIIPNHANIFFDYNAPVRTNTATTAVMNPTAVLANHRAAAWTAYPNPATNAVTLAADLTLAGPVRITLLDVLGRPVQQHTLQAPAGALRQTLDLHGLPPGAYVLRLVLPDGTSSSRTVLRN